MSIPHVPISLRVSGCASCPILTSAFGGEVRPSHVSATPEMNTDRSDFSTLDREIVNEVAALAHVARTSSLMLGTSQ